MEAYPQLEQALVEGLKGNLRFKELKLPSSIKSKLVISLLSSAVPLSNAPWFVQEKQQIFWDGS